MAEPSPCANHPDRPATYRCDGCHRALCDDCVQMSHRLILCKVCGEMAIPLATGRATSSTVVRRKQAIERPYSLFEALLYPLRGHGSGVFWTYIVLLTAFSILPLLVPLFGCVLLLPALIVAIMVPRLLFTIVRATAEGENELPEWPEFDFWARLIDAMAYALIIFIAWIPTIVLVSISNCSGLGLFTLSGAAASEGPSCLGPLVLGFLLSAMLWIPTFGAPSVYDSFWLLPRVDLHVRALLVAPAEAGIMALLLGGLLVVGFGLGTIFRIIPLVGVAAGSAIMVYAQFTGAHVVGIYFRRHAAELERLYLG